jgi:hypothetical protein
MKKKIFISKDSPSGFRSYLKFLLWAAIGLVVLVLFIPLTSRQKSGKEAVKKPASERGVVVREIPKSLQPIAESISKGPGGSGEAPKEADSKPAVIPEGKSPGEATGTSQQAAIKEKPLDAAAASQKAEAGSEGYQKSPAGRLGSSEPATGQVSREVQAVPKVSEVPVKEPVTALPQKPEAATPAVPDTKQKTTASVATPPKQTKPAAAEPKPGVAPSAATPDAHKQAAAEGGKMYAVQIATLKDKQGAEELKKTLQKKGFDVVLKTANDPKHGQSYTLQLQPVDTASKAATLMEQVKYVPQVKPTIVPVSKE